jgi:hypothetical protein
MANTTLIASVVGIGVSGVIGPAATAWATRRANREAFERDRQGKRRDDFAELVDEAAALLASGATNLRLLAEANERGDPLPADIEDWLGHVFPLQERLRLRRPAADPVVAGYARVRQRLMEIGAHPAGSEAQQAAVLLFESERDGFLDAARSALQQPVETSEAG